jgi:hypothetical protein
MLNITDSERAFLEEMRALARDGKGNEVLIGLTAEESQFYFDYVNERLVANMRRREDGDRYLKLHDKHEGARLAVIFAEAEARGDASSRH